MSRAALIERAQRLREAHLLDRGVTSDELRAAPAGERERLGRIRGEANQLRVTRALSAAPLPNWIVSFRPGRFAEDKRGGDLMFLCEDQARYRIEIKSSWTGAERFEAEGRLRGRTSPIGLLVLADDMTDEQIVDRVLGILQLLRAYRAAEIGAGGSR